MGRLKGQEHALIQPSARRLQVGLEGDEIAIELDILLALGHENVRATDRFTQVQALAEFLLQPGL